MHFLAFLAVAAVGPPAPLAPAADLSKVDRRISKEPDYKTKAPRYSLLVFGPAAKTRVWVVLDGTDLYVDTNGDGDLTAPGKRFPGDGAGFKDCTLVDKAGKDTYKLTYISVQRSEAEKRVFLMANVEVVGKYKQYCDSTPAKRPADAPVSHFHGPLTLGLREVNWVCRQKLVAGDKPAELFAWVGTFDKANGCWVVVSNTVLDTPGLKRKDFPTDVHPVAEVEFRPKKVGDKPIRERYELKRRC